MTHPVYIDVLLPLPLPDAYTYGVRAEQADRVKIGMRVTVPFGKRKILPALVVNVHHQSPQDYAVREIISLMDPEPVVILPQIRLWEWISTYYLCATGEVFKAAVPARLKWNTRSSAKADSVPAETGLSALNFAQGKALKEIRSAFSDSDVVLLHGVTSSGKTEVYMHLIQDYLRQGRQVLYLLPEIALTTQIIARLKAVFGKGVAVYHSRSTDAQRAQTWIRLLRSETVEQSPVQIILGVRSAVFLPFKNLGLVIVDEEHENTYKQFDPAPRYHARDTAIMLAQQLGSKVLLGTATPSLETYYNCTTGKYKRITLNERFLNLALPEIVVVNTRELRRRKQMQSHFSPVLLRHMETMLQQGEQIILFQNRRGFSRFIECFHCGEVPKCRYCDVSLTYHKNENRLKCHYCGRGIPVPGTCTVCGQADLRMKGFGTEKIEDEIALLFPTARIERLDLDSTRSRKSYEELINRFEQKQSDILVGTQMVSKGLDFENVKLVGIMDADTMLHFPDFRAHERSYQLMAQVSGRAGRKGSRGLVIIQASDHQHPVIQQVINHDYQALFEEQLEERRRFSYPPFSRLVEITLKHRDRDLLDQAAVMLADHLRLAIREPVMGPEYPLVSRIRNQYLKRLLVKMVKGKDLSFTKEKIAAAIRTMHEFPEFRPVQYTLDVDPY